LALADDHRRTGYLDLDGLLQEEIRAEAEGCDGLKSGK
jgi:hypothetical protein